MIQDYLFVKARKRGRRNTTLNMPSASSIRCRGHWKTVLGSLPCLQYCVVFWTEQELCEETPGCRKRISNCAVTKSIESQAGNLNKSCNDGYLGVGIPWTNCVFYRLVNNVVFSLCVCLLFSRFSRGCHSGFRFDFSIDCIANRSVGASPIRTSVWCNPFVDRQRNIILQHIFAEFFFIEMHPI